MTEYDTQCHEGLYLSEGCLCSSSVKSFLTARTAFEGQARLDACATVKHGEAASKLIQNMVSTFQELNREL